MKSRKQPEPTNVGTTEAPAQIAPAPPVKRMSLVETLHKEFENFASSTFPSEFANEDDRKILMATWFAAIRQSAALITNNTLKPFYDTAEKEAMALLDAIKGA
jgi:hypothetical protein